MPAVGVLVVALVGLGGGPAAAEPGAEGAPTPSSGSVTGATEVTVPAPDGVTFTEIQAGTIHTLGLGSDGRAYAWGYNSQGQLGTGDNTAVPTPVPVAVPEGVTFSTLDAGGEFSVGLATDGAVYTWGLNSEGMIGNGTTENVNVPTRVELPGGVAAVGIAAGEYAVLALGEDGAVYGWGRNNTGALGTGTTTRMELVPVAAIMPAGVSFTSLATSNYHSLAVTDTGQAYGWGRNGSGELGLGTESNTHVTTPEPVVMPTGVGFTSVSAGGAFSVGVGDDGAVYTWGSNASGQLGTGTGTASSVPVQAQTPGGVTFVAAAAAAIDSEDAAGRGAGAGGYHSLALGSDGEAYAWGKNEQGQLGNGTQVDSETPIRVHRPEGVQFTEVGTGVFNSVALSSTGAAYTWGYNPLWQAGDPTAPQPFVLEPFPVAMDPTVTGIAFDGIDGTELTQQESGDWSAVTPEHAAGPVDVVVSWAQLGLEREPVTYAGGFTYIGPGLAVAGVKRVGEIAHAAPGLPAAAPGTWDITATRGDDVRVISGDDAEVLPLGESYVLGERVSADAPQAELAERYAPQGTFSCVDAEGAALPTSVFDPGTGTLTVPDTEDAVAAPVTCEVTNQAAHASFVIRSGDGPTAAPAAGWGLALDPAERAAGTELGDAAASAVVLPGDYGLTATVPAGMRASGVERLSADAAGCADAAADPIAAPETCWTQLPAAESVIPQGAHTAFRVTAIAQDDGGTTEPGEPTTTPTTTPPKSGDAGPLAATGGANYTPLVLAAVAAALGGLALWRRGRAAEPSVEE